MNKLFDPGLYRLGLRRTRVAGICSSVICVVGSALVPLVNMIAQSQRNMGYYSIDISYYSYALLLWALIALAPVIMYTAFSFLTNRRDSDFYHSLPATRSALYFSFFAAAMTWIWGILLVTVIVSGLLWLALYLMVPTVTLSMSTVWTVLLHFGISTLCTAALVPAALAATGTAVSAIGLYGCVMLLPKLTIWIFTECLIEYAPFIYISEELENYLSFMLFEPLSLICQGPKWPPLIYSTVLALVHIAAGWLIFRVRKSESAGMPAPGKWQQTLYRTLISLPTAMLCVYIAFLNADTELLWVLAVVTVVIYYLYELITTKKLRSMLAATRTVWILPFFCSLFACCIWLTGTAFWLSTPTDPDDIDHVRLAQGSNSFYLWVEEKEQDLLEYYELAEAPITDKTVHRVVTELLSYDHDWGSDDNRYHYALVELTTKSGRTVVRKLFEEDPSSVYTKKAAKELESIMELIPSQYRSEYSTTTDCLMAMATDLVPDPECRLYGSECAYWESQSSIRISLGEQDLGYYYDKYLPVDLDGEAAARLLETYVSEFNALPHEQRRALSLDSIDRYNGVLLLDALTVTPHSWCYPLISPYICLYIDAELTPQSYELLVQLYEAVKDEFDDNMYAVEVDKVETWYNDVEISEVEISQ